MKKNYKKNINLKGIGLHNGEDVNLTIRPADPNTGIIFQRTDINNNNIIHANFKNVVEPILYAIEKRKGVTVSTVEHLMAVFCEGIDNALVEAMSEIPIMDDVDAIRSVGIEQGQPKSL